jgi:hypothetical protein
MSSEPSNEQRLRDAGVIIDGDLPEEHQAVVDGLDESQMSTILDLKDQLDDAASGSGESIAEHWIAP